MKNQKKIFVLKNIKLIVIICKVILDKSIYKLNKNEKKNYKIKKIKIKSK